MSYYRPPDEAEQGPGGGPADPFASMPSPPSAAAGRPAALDGEVEEIWVVVATEPEPLQAQRLEQALQAHDLEVWVRPWDEFHLSTGMMRVYEVLVPEVDEARARGVLDGYEQRPSEADLLEASLRGPQPGDEIFLLQEQVDAEMPDASKRQRRSEYRRRRARLDPGWAGAQHAPPWVGWVAVACVAFLIAGFLLALAGG